jgi:hypothetical protein
MVDENDSSTEERTAQRNSGTFVEHAKRHIQDLASNIIKIHIQVSYIFDFFAECGIFVVERLDNAKVLLQPFALVPRSCNSIYLCAIPYPELTRQGADGSCSTRNKQGLACFKLPDVLETLHAADVSDS